MLDSIIIGQGLAGSLLGIELIEAGQKVLVIDNNYHSSSTKLAAGMMNPIVGKRLRRLWASADEKDVVIDYYRGLEERLKTPLLRAHQLLRCLSRTEELEKYKKRRHDPDYAKDMKAISNEDRFKGLCDLGQAQFISPEVFQLDTRALLSSAKQYFKDHDSYQEADCRYDEILLSDQTVSWQGKLAKTLIFCEGARGEHNPFFQHLDFENAMGEILDIDCAGIPKNWILNHGKWLCPMGEGGIYRYGASSYWEDNPAARERSEALLKTTLSQFLKVPYTVTDVHHGVRPVLKSRTVFADRHPEHQQLAMINGLGGQGCSLAPRAVQRLHTELGII